MATNLLLALLNFIKNPDLNLGTTTGSQNRINSVGEGLETYIKNLFCNCTDKNTKAEKIEKYNENFSYIGNQNNPPDLMLKNGDAIEIKKINAMKSDIALNSSYPKDKLSCKSTLLNKACRTCETWEEKDLLYIIGVPEKNGLKSLWFVYGDCYCANNDVYEKIKVKVSEGINKLGDIEVADTNELARVNKVDPLGITYLRIRGMWGITNPMVVFDYLKIKKESPKFFFNVIMLKEKYLSFPKENRDEIESMISAQFSIQDVKIQSPNNPANLLEAKLLSYGS